MDSASLPLDFTLPPELEATTPPEARGVARDGVRLLVSHRSKDGLVHATFRDLPRFLRAGDLLVVNDSETLPAALPARTSTGDEIRLHLSTRLPTGLWVVEPRTSPPSGVTQESRGTRVGTSPPGPLSQGERGDNGHGRAWLGGVLGAQPLELPGGGVATLFTPYAGSRRLWVARLDLPARWLDYLRRWGKPIAYPYVRGEWPIEMYQTMFAARPGSAEMPSAGRPFTPAVVEALRHEDVRLASITLHTGVASLEHDEPPYPECVEVPAATAEIVAATRGVGGRVLAVGTTVVRALESAADVSGHVAAPRAWTDLVVTPERGVRVVDGLLTGFHEPRATHLMLLEAIAGRAHVRKAYRAALAAGYLWHEFGDVHLIL
jgi:S-adenosylmethionine:tRNA ribosyltransferase-isomerase